MSILQDGMHINTKKIRVTTLWFYTSSFYNSGKRLIEREYKFKIQKLELASVINKTPST